MSHTTVYLTKLGNLNPQMLKAAVEYFAKMLGATVFHGTIHNEYDDETRQIIVGFKTDDLPHGIGFNLDHAGNLVIVGDPYDQAEAYQKFIDMATSGQITNAYQIAMNAQENNETVDSRVEGDSIIMEVNPQ
jgi:hypothetical protein